MPKVSVIIPVFNAQDYLAECLDSVINQTFWDMEIICIDDASTDGSLDILQQYAHKDFRLTILRNRENRGLSFTRNVGLENASGDYVLFVDSDDYIDKKLVSLTVEVSENADIVCFDYVKNDELGNSHDEHLFDIESGRHSAMDYFTETVEKNSIVYSAWSKLYSRKFLIKNNIKFINGIKYEDVVFNFLCMMKADTIYCLKEKLYTYRIRSDSIMTANIDGKNVTDYFYIICWLTHYYLGHYVDVGAERAVEKYIHTVFHSFISCYRRYASDNDGYTLKNDLKKDIAKLYGIVTGYENYHGLLQQNIEERIETIREAKHIILYGAGDIAREVLEVLNRYDIAIDGIAVSNRLQSKRSLLGNRVCAVTEYIDKKEDSLIIMATSPKFYSEIRENLLQLGFRYYMEIF